MRGIVRPRLLIFFLIILCHNPKIPKLQPHNMDDNMVHLIPATTKLVYQKPNGAMNPRLQMELRARFGAERTANFMVQWRRKQERKAARVRRRIVNARARAEAAGVHVITDDDLPDNYVEIETSTEY